MYSCNGNKDLGGLQNIVSASTTAGGLAPASFPWWVSTVTTGGSFAGQGLDDMRSTMNTVTFSNDKPDICFTTQDIFEFYEKSLQPQARYSQMKVADAGFQNRSG